MGKELTIKDRLDMIEECNRKANEFMARATDEDYKALFSELPKSNAIPKIEM